MTEADRQPPTASPYQIFMLVCCVLVLVALVVELALPLDPEILRILFYADTAFCVVFFADFLLSLARAKDRKRYMLTGAGSISSPASPRSRNSAHSESAASCGF